MTIMTNNRIIKDKQHNNHRLSCLAVEASQRHLELYMLLHVRQVQVRRSGQGCGIWFSKSIKYEYQIIINNNISSTDASAAIRPRMRYLVLVGVSYSRFPQHETRTFDSRLWNLDQISCAPKKKPASKSKVQSLKSRIRSARPRHVSGNRPWGSQIS